LTFAAHAQLAKRVKCDGKTCLLNFSKQTSKTFPCLAKGMALTSTATNKEKSL
jgi:hypothetical protein